jgi:hypothetical protein
MMSSGIYILVKCEQCDQKSVFNNFNCVTLCFFIHFTLFVRFICAAQ